MLNNSANKKRKSFFTKYVCMGVAVLFFTVSTTAKTRWSSLRLVPDADFLSGGEWSVGFDGFLTRGLSLDSTNVDSLGVMDSSTADTLKPTLFRQTYLLNMGIIEWVNFQVGYADGFTLGFKARILGETRRFMPSVAIGMQGIFNSKEVNYYNYTGTDNYNSEFYIALGKSIEAVKLRLHGGILSVPAVKSERFNPYFALEKYFGFGLYASLEGYKRDNAFHMSIFGNFRGFKDRLELSVGVVEIKSMLVDNSGQFSFSLSPRTFDNFVSPGIWFGIRFHGLLHLGRGTAFVSVEDRLAEQDTTINMFRNEIDSLHKELKDAYEAVAKVNETIDELVDSVGAGKMKTIILSKLAELESAYEAEPFDPKKVKDITNQIVRFGDDAVLALQSIVRDKRSDRKVRIHAITCLGDIGNTNASEALLDVIAQTGDPDLKIEILIALGKMKETRAMYLMEQLANDANDAVALTAQEVLRQISKSTGAKSSANLKTRNVGPIIPDEVVPEKSIDVQ